MKKIIALLLAARYILRLVGNRYWFAFSACF